MMHGNDWMDSSGNLFTGVPRHNENIVGASLKILFLITDRPYGFPEVTVYRTETPLQAS